VSPLEIASLNRGRTTFQRIADARFFNGWVKVITAEVVVAHTCTSCTLNPGDEFAFQVYGNKKDVFFHAKLKAFQRADIGPFAADCVGSTVGLNLGCQILTPMTFREGVSQPRFCVEGVTADIVANEDRVTEGAVVIDIGPGGFAALTVAHLRKGDLVNVNLSAFGQTVLCQAEVRNTTRNALDARYQRTGFQILTMERVDRLRWKQVYSLVLEANKQQAAKFSTTDRLGGRRDAA
jgi:hypothetical protein